MISRERVIRTLNHQPIDRAPATCGSPRAWRRTALTTWRRSASAFPPTFCTWETTSHPARRGKSHGHAAKAGAGTHTDAWGCTWETGGNGELTLAESPLAGAAALAAFRPPAALLETAHFSKVNPVCEGTGRFTLAASELHPLERLCELRGPETALRELGEGNIEVRDLLTKLHDFIRREAEQWAKTLVDGVVLGDDLTWAAQSRGNLKLWRAIVKPFFRDYCATLHGQDKFVFFQAHGPVGDVMDDLIEIGVNAIHAQWPLDEFLKLAAAHRGQITFWGGMENRRLEPPATQAEIRDAVQRVRKAADFGNGVIISQITWTKSIPLKNIAAFFEQWMIPLPVAV